MTTGLFHESFKAFEGSATLVVCEIQTASSKLKMADAIPGTLFSLVSKAKILVVGAGGIGCELLKNLVLSGFTDIVVVSLPGLLKIILCNLA